MNVINELIQFLRTMGMDYAICGGSAIDLFVGRKTRAHKDLDVAVYWENRDEIVRYMLDSEWELYEPTRSRYLHKIVAPETQKREKSNIWCVKKDNASYRFTERENYLFDALFDGTEQTELNFIEFLFNKRDEKFFYYARNERIKRALPAAILKTSDICYLAPEIVLLYKSTAAGKAEYQMDFDNAYPHMHEEQISWLMNALMTMNPDGHRWLEKVYRP